MLAVLGENMHFIFDLGFSKHPPPLKDFGHYLTIIFGFILLLRNFPPFAVTFVYIVSNMQGSSNYTY